MRKFLNKAALLLMLLTMGIFTACGSMSAEDVELLDSVLTTVLEVAEQAAEAEETESSAEEWLEAETVEAERIEEKTAAESERTETAAESESTEMDAEPEGIPEPVSEPQETVQETDTAEVSEDSDFWEVTVSEDGEYTSAEEVSLYLHLYDHLPDNYITKKEARALGWDSSRGNLWDVAPGMSIGGDYFGNYEGLLPEDDDRDYYECDIDYEGGYRNAKRIIFSDDGLIFYTEDHYESFEQLY